MEDITGLFWKKFNWWQKTLYSFTGAIPYTYYASSIDDFLKNKNVVKEDHPHIDSAYMCLSEVTYQCFENSKVTLEDLTEKISLVPDNYSQFENRIAQNEIIKGDKVIAFMKYYVNRNTASIITLQNPKVGAKNEQQGSLIYGLGEQLI